MNWTNKQGLPYPVVKAATGKSYTKGDADFSVTELNMPPRMRQLLQRHAEKLTRDVADSVAAMMGEALHLLFHQHYDPKDLAEKIMTVPVEVDGKTYKLKGQPDLYSVVEDYTLFDYKFTSVWAWIMGGKVDWERQLNVYVRMLNAAAFPVKRIRAVGFWKDWKKSEAATNQDYPANNSTLVEVAMWQPEATDAYVAGRIKAHVAAAALPDAELPDCTDEERWARGASFAVMKGTRKSALKLFRLTDFNGDKKAAKAAAVKRAAEEGGFVVERQAQSIRCMHWCDAAPFCGQFANILAETASQPAEAAA